MNKERSVDDAKQYYIYSYNLKGIIAYAYKIVEKMFFFLWCLNLKWHGVARQGAPVSGLWHTAGEDDGGVPPDPSRRGSTTAALAPPVAGPVT